MWFWCRAWLGSTPYLMIHLDFERNRIFQFFFFFYKRSNSCHILLPPSVPPYIQSVPSAPRKNSFSIHWVTFAHRWHSWLLKRPDLTCSPPVPWVHVERRPARLWHRLLGEELLSSSCSVMTNLEMLLLSRCFPSSLPKAWGANQAGIDIFRPAS